MMEYIHDKNLYRAVMGACSWIRQDGYFNKAINFYAKKYDVDPDDVAKYVRQRQSDGQKRANKKRAPRKYYWFAVEYSMGNERNVGPYFEELIAQYTVAKGLTEKSIKDRLSAPDDYMNEYAPCHWFGRVKPFDTKDEATSCIKAWNEERKARLRNEFDRDSWEMLGLE